MRRSMSAGAYVCGTYPSLCECRSLAGSVCGVCADNAGSEEKAPFADCVLFLPFSLFLPSYLLLYAGRTGGTWERTVRCRGRSAVRTYALFS